MEFDPLFLSRVQFAWVIAWHVLMPAFTVGVASYIALLEGTFLATGKAVYLRVSMFWIRVFAIAFAMGVVTGVVMPFQFGTNWSRFSDATANVLSPLFAYEGLTAFFLEASFLGVLLFGRDLVPRWAHFVAALMVALGTLMSTFWILSANSWMQTPAGFEMIDGRFHSTDWVKVIFNPSFPYRFAHTVLGFYITTGFVVAAVGAWYVRRGRGEAEGRVMLSMSLWLLTAMVPLQLFIGDAHGLNTREHQPAKIAAIEARWETMKGAPLTLFAIPDEAAEENRHALDIPLLGSLILTHSLDGEVQGLKDWPPEDRPPVMLPFFAFRVMVGCGLLMLGLVLWGSWLRYRDRLFDASGFLIALQVAAPLGYIAILAGWTTTEVGRQPWTVYGLLRTADSVTPSLTGTDVALSLLGYVLVYLVMYPIGFLLMARLIRKGPAQVADAAVEAGRPAGPFTATDTDPKAAR